MHIQQWIQHFGYPGVFLILALEMIGIPIPAETMLTVSGIEWNKGILSLTPLLIAAILGNVAGSSIAYGLGRFLGRSIIIRFGKIIGITPKRLDKAELKFQKYQNSLILFAKFIAGVRVLVPYLAGINRMSFIKFSIYNTLSSMVWVTCFVFIGKYVGKEWIRYHKTFQHLLLPMICIIILMVSLYLLLKMLKKKQPKLNKVNSRVFSD